jgi:hypothetical protein
MNSVAGPRSAAEHSADHAKHLSSGPSSSIQKVAGRASGWARRATGDTLTATLETAANLGTRLTTEKPSDDEPKG